MSTVRIQLRRGTSTEWGTADAIGAGVVLAAGEVGFVTDENTFKVGDGSTKFGNLPYILESSLGDYIPLSQFGTPSGVATLDSSGLLNTSQLPPLSKVTVASAANQAARLALTAQPGDIAIQTDNGQSYVLTASPASTNGNWQALVGSEAVVDTVEAALVAGTGLDKTYDDAAGTITIDIDSTVATLTGTQTLTNKTLTSPVINTPTGIVKADVGLSNVDNTSDADKPVSTATQTALDAKASNTALSTHNSDTTDVHGIADTALLATKTYATQAAADAVAGIILTAPSTLNTLSELATALGEDANFSATITSSIATKLPLAGGTMTGNIAMGGARITGLNAPTDSDEVATKSFAEIKASDAQTDAQTYASNAVSTHNSDSTSVHGIADTALLATKEYADGAVSTHNSDTTDVHGIADTALLATKQYADTAVSTHNSDTTDVHGISNTANLVYTVDLSGHNSDTTDVHGISNTANLVYTTDLSGHNSDTTNVHGIADVSALATKTYADDAVGVEITNRNAAITTAIGTEVNDRNTAIGAHNSDTTNVHGIADTALLATMGYADGAVSTAVAALTKTSVGLANVDNTSDANKPVSTATQTALNLKANLDSPTFTGTVTLPANTISQSMMGDDSVGTNEIGGLAVTTEKIAALAVTEGKIADSAVTSAKIADGTIVNADINASAAIAQSKIADLTTDLAAKASLSGATFTGNVEMDGNLVVDGDLTVNGTNFSASATSITIEDNMVQLAHQNAANTVDLGLVVGYNDGAAKHAGLVRDVSDAKWKLFKGVTTEPSTTVDFTQGSLDDLAVAGFTASSATIGDVSNTELQYLNNVSSNIQTQLDAKLASGTASTTYETITNVNLKAPKADPTFTGTVTVSASGVAFTDGTQTKAGVPSLTTIALATSGAYNLSTGGLALRDQLIPVGGTHVITVPTNTTTAYPVGTTISFYQSAGTGGSFVGADVSVTILSTPGSTLRALYSSATLTKVATNTWLLAGDLKA